MGTKTKSSMAKTKKMKRFIIIAVAVFLSDWGAAQMISNERLDSLIAGTISKYHIPSMAVAVIRPDTVYYGIQGHIRMDTLNEAQLTDKFHIGSCTKAFTSFLAFQAIENDKISLETKFLDLYPELKGVRREFKDITLSDLLSHNARIRPYTKGKEFERLPAFSGSAPEKRYEFAKAILKQKPVRKGVYSNGGFVLAAMMLEKRYELPFESILKNAMDKMGLKCMFGGALRLITKAL
jgi:CubicO group peptidase (beta-lactamase class C family)